MNQVKKDIITRAIFIRVIKRGEDINEVMNSYTNLTEEEKEEISLDFTPDNIEHDRQLLNM